MCPAMIRRRHHEYSKMHASGMQPKYPFATCGVHAPIPDHGRNGTDIVWVPGLGSPGQSQLAALFPSALESERRVGANPRTAVWTTAQSPVAASRINSEKYKEMSLCAPHCSIFAVEAFLPPGPSVPASGLVSLCLALFCRCSKASRRLPCTLTLPSPASTESTVLLRPHTPPQLGGNIFLLSRKLTLPPINCCGSVLDLIVLCRRVVPGDDQKIRNKAASEILVF